MITGPGRARPCRYADRPRPLPAARLPNGDVLATNSMSGLIVEVDRAGKIVQSFTNTSFGYVDFRTSLYGPPPR